MKLDTLVPSSDEGTERWEKSVESEDGTCRRMMVEKISNGFLITIEISNYRKEPSINRRERIFSKKNPLEGSEYAVTDNNSVMNILTDFFSDKKQLL